MFINFEKYFDVKISESEISNSNDLENFRR